MRSTRSPATTPPVPGPTARGSGTVRLHVLGTLDLLGPDGARLSSVVAQPKRLCLLAYLALAPRPVSRATLVALFWPSSDETRARNALSQALHYLRRSLGEGVIENVDGDRLRVSAEVVWCDARALLDAAEPSEELLANAEHDVMEGWNAEDSQPLQDWLDGVRRTVRERARSLRADAVRAGDGAALVPVPREATDAGGPPIPPSLRAGRRWSARRAKVGVATVLAVTVVAVLALATAARTSPEARTLIVLLPRLTGDGGATRIPPMAIHDELIARLHLIEGPRVVSAPYFTSLESLQRQMTALGDIDESPLVLGVSALALGDRTTVFGFLYRSPSFEVVGGSRFELDVVDARGLHDVPFEIATRVGGMVEEILTERRTR